MDTAIQSASSNGSSRSRRSHFSHGDSIQETTEVEVAVGAAKDPGPPLTPRISYENERLILFSNSPHSWAVPRDWMQICDKYPNIIRNKVIDKANNNSSVGVGVALCN